MHVDGFMCIYALNAHVMADFPRSRGFEVEGLLLAWGKLYHTKSGTKCMSESVEKIYNEYKFMCSMFCLELVRCLETYN